MAACFRYRLGATIDPLSIMFPPPMPYAVPFPAKCRGGCPCGKQCSQLRKGNTTAETVRAICRSGRVSAVDSLFRLKLLVSPSIVLSKRIPEAALGSGVAGTTG